MTEKPGGGLRRRERPPNIRISRPYSASDICRKSLAVFPILFSVSLLTCILRALSLCCQRSCFGLFWVATALTEESKEDFLDAITT